MAGTGFYRSTSNEALVLCATLEGVIRSAHAQRCDLGADPSTALDSYPCGRRALERDWQRWVGRGLGT